MENLDKNMVKEILTTIQSEGIIGFQLLSTLKERNPDFDETPLYMTLKSLIYFLYLFYYLKFDNLIYFVRF